jgi:hypothetical protein
MICDTLKIESCYGKQTHPRSLSLPKGRKGEKSKKTEKDPSADSRAKFLDI